ncbi:MAG: lipopolysaccharide biosynthesis protein [Prevotella sp.]|jgi:O-antigen/teichoic acid export membrane protein|nr:lipopolysaccharide biosynthesis protein [Prevotella sp.]
MANMKSLAKDTAIYGLSSIIGRFLNYLLVPLYTTQMSAAGGGYGVITNMYALVALILVLLTFGMETTFFRFANKEGENPQRVFSTALIGVSSAATLFVVLVLLFITPVSSFLGYADHPSYVWVMALTIGIDAIRAIPFVYLRQQKKAIKFASLQLLNIAINITLNLIYYKWFNVTDPGYAFYINLVTSTVVLLCLYKELFSIRHGFDPQLMRRMLSYSWPIVILGVAGILNQVADKILFPFVYKGSDMQMQLGIYGATVKIAMIMAMITQAFRYAYEPFVFGKTHDKDNDEMQATAMKYFLIFTLLAFLCVVGYIDVLKYIIGDDYWEGLRVIPIVMAAEIMMGVYFNLSFWYKLEDKTFWGAVFSTVGCGVLIAGNVLFVPRYGYMACAWSGFAGYATAMTLSYIVGRIYHPIAYPLRSIAIYVGMTLLFFVAMSYGREYLPLWASLGVNTLLVLLFCAYIVRYDMPLSSLPVIGKFFNKK